METYSQKPNLILWKYWEGPKPDYIKKIDLQTPKYTSYEVVIVTPDNIKKFLDVPAQAWSIKKPAHRADLFRVMLIEKYGGFWIDSDSILTKNIDYLFSCLNEYGVVGFVEDANLNNGKVRIGLMGGAQNNIIFEKWRKDQVHVIQSRSMFPWTYIGADMLTKYCRQHTNLCKMFKVEEILPYPWTYSNIVYEDLPIDSIVKDDTISVSFYHSQLPSYDFKPNTLGYRLLEHYG